MRFSSLDGRGRAVRPVPAVLIGCLMGGALAAPPAALQAGTTAPAAQGPASAPPPPRPAGATSGLRIDLLSPGHPCAVEFYLTDPAGRRSGRDGAAKPPFGEIPGAEYDASAGLDDDEREEPDPNAGRSLEVYGIADGDFLVTVSGIADGTYDAEIRAFDTAGGRRKAGVHGVPVSTGAVHLYRVHFEGADSSRMAIAGGFGCCPQETGKSTRLLTYASPVGEVTMLPAGTREFPLVVFYGAAIDPATLGAHLGGVDVAALFHPAPGGHEVVLLPLAPGRNVLEVSILGRTCGGPSKDFDALVLQVPRGP